MIVNYQYFICCVLLPLLTLDISLFFFFLDTFDAMKNNSGTYYIIVVEDTEENCIVASGSLTIEKKFIHLCGQVSHNCGI
jgi:hypothetical protein